MPTQAEAEKKQIAAYISEMTHEEIWVHLREKMAIPPSTLHSELHHQIVKLEKIIEAAKANSANPKALAANEYLLKLLVRCYGVIMGREVENRVDETFALDLECARLQYAHLLREYKKLAMWLNYSADGVDKDKVYENMMTSFKDFNSENRKTVMDEAKKVIVDNHELEKKLRADTKNQNELSAKEQEALGREALKKKNS